MTPLPPSGPGKADDSAKPPRNSDESPEPGSIDEELEPGVFIFPVEEYLAEEITLKDTEGGRRTPRRSPGPTLGPDEAAPRVPGPTIGPDEAAPLAEPGGVEVSPPAPEIGPATPLAKARRPTLIDPGPMPVLGSEMDRGSSRGPTLGPEGYEFEEQHTLGERDTLDAYPGGLRDSTVSGQTVPTVTSVETTKTQERTVSPSEPPARSQDRDVTGLPPGLSRRAHRMSVMEQMLGPEAPAPIDLGSRDAYTTSAAPEAPGATPGSAPLRRRSGVHLSDRYDDAGQIGIGGMGEVRRVIDRDLNRVVALKIIRADLMSNPRAVARFVEEAQTTGQLQHSSIVPVHELGRLPDGRLYFTMFEVKGKTFDDVIAEYHEQKARPDTAAEGAWTFRRLVDIFVKACEAIAYAHSRGVIHRDIKPENILVGKYGEVLVVDWGLAKILHRPDAMVDLIGEDVILTDRSQDETKATLAGTIAGTPAFMPIEQAAGLRERQGPHSDVYSLGAVLYNLLVGHPPYEGKSVREILRKVLTAAPPPPEGRGIPEELSRICMKAMARQTEQRYPDAEHLLEAVTSWLDGAKRREEALRLVEQAKGKSQRISSLRARAEALQAQAEEIMAQVAPTDPISEKRVAWIREGEAKQLRRGAEVLEAQMTQLARAALEQVPDLSEGHAFLADFYHARHREAEERRDQGVAAAHEILLRHHDLDGRYTSYIEGDGALTLHTDPPGAEVEIFRYVERDRRVVTEPYGQKLSTPVDAFPLPMGSYLLVVRGSYRIPVRYPIVIDRQSHWDGVRPGATEPTPIRLPKIEELGDEDIFVPAGWFWSGGDPRAPNALERRRIWVDSFVIKRFSVTNQQYIDFLDDLIAQGREKDAQRFAPRARGVSFGSEGPVVFGQHPDGKFYLRVDPDGNIWERDWPVLLINWHGANAYASWRSVRDRVRWQLATEHQWEKAGRGVDGRFYPWGNYLDPTWCVMRQSHVERALPEAVGSRDEDESPYGARDMAGNVRNWCRNEYTVGGAPVENGCAVVPSIPVGSVGKEQRAVRGGAWDEFADACRLSYRTGYLPEDRLRNVGFRLARPFEAS